MADVLINVPTSRAVWNAPAPTVTNWLKMTRPAQTWTNVWMKHPNLFSGVAVRAVLASTLPDRTDAIVPTVTSPIQRPITALMWTNALKILRARPVVPICPALTGANAIRDSWVVKTVPVPILTNALKVFAISCAPTCPVRTSVTVTSVINWLVTSVRTWTSAAELRKTNKCLQRHLVMAFVATRSVRSNVFVPTVSDLKMTSASISTSAIWLIHVQPEASALIPQDLIRVRVKSVTKCPTTALASVQ